MPDKEGIEALLEIKKDFADLRVISISGGGQAGPENYLKLAETFGVSYTFTKPINNNELLKKIQELIV